MKDQDKVKGFERFADAVKSRLEADRANNIKAKLYREGLDVPAPEAHLVAKESGANAVFEVDPEGKAAVRYSVDTQDGTVRGLTAREALKKLRGGS